MVSYGGVSGGLRSVESLLPVLSVLKVVPLPEAVVFPFVSRSVKDGHLEASDLQQKAASTMRDELVRWSAALRTLR